MVSPETPITNCHGTVIQAFADGWNQLHLVTYQRSADVVCGVSHNWLQYWAFLLWLANVADLNVGSLTWIGGDVHLYEQHVPMARRLTELKDQQQPELLYTPSGGEFKADDFSLSSCYTPQISENVVMVV
jgi:thymidylate synthase